MRIHSKNLKKIAEQAGISAVQLAEALPAESGRRKQKELAQSKVRNWMAGRDHPRAKAKDIEAMAGVLGCAPSQISRYTSEFKFSRSAPRKACLVVDLIRGRSVAEAQALLAFSPKRAAVMVGKALNAALAEAESYDASPDRLVVAESRVDKGVIIKRFQPKDRGRAHRIEKITSHITIGLEERA